MPPKKSSTSASKHLARPENPTVLPAVSLRPLQPRDGGYWAVTGQCEDTFTLSYFMNGGTEGIAYAMQPCTTEEDIRKYCAEHLYDLAQRKFVDLLTEKSSNQIACPSQPHSNKLPTKPRSRYSFTRPKQFIFQSDALSQPYEHQPAAVCCGFF